MQGFRASVFWLSVGSLGLRLWLVSMVNVQTENPQPQ